MQKMMMRHSNVRPAFRAVVFFLGVLVAFGACKKPEDNVGLDILDPADALGVTQTDTISIQTYSLPDDSVRTSNLSRNMVGSFLDPDFGLVETSTYTQIRLSTNNVGEGQLPIDLEVDSIILSLGYTFGDPWYGQPDEQTFAVYEVDEEIILDTTYYATDVLAVLSENLIEPGMEAQTPDTNAITVVDGDTLLPQLRIRLKDDLGRRFLDAWGSPDLVDNDAFLQFFKGLYVTTENAGQAPDEGAALQFDMLSVNSKVTLYYRNIVVGEEDTLAYDFEIDQQAARFTHVTLDHAQAPMPIVEQALGDTTIGQELFFVQSGQGVRGAIYFPYLEHLLDSGWTAVAKAELIIPVLEPTNDKWTPPSSLFIFRKSETGGDLFLPDQFELNNNIGGIYNEDDKEYRFNISRYVQQVLNGTLENAPLELAPANRGVSVARGELMGPQNIDRQARLIITFTEL